RAKKARVSAVPAHQNRHCAALAGPPGGAPSARTPSVTPPPRLPETSGLRAGAVRENGCARFATAARDTSGAAAVSTPPGAHALVAFGRSQNTAASPAESAPRALAAWGGSHHGS